MPFSFPLSWDIDSDPMALYVVRCRVEWRKTPTHGNGVSLQGWHTEGEGGAVDRRRVRDRVWDIVSTGETWSLYCHHGPPQPSPSSCRWLPSISWNSCNIVCSFTSPSSSLISFVCFSKFLYWVLSHFPVSLSYVWDESWVLFGCWERVGKWRVLLLLVLLLILWFDEILV